MSAPFDTLFPALGAAVVAFVWQGTLIGLLVALALRFAARRADERYAVLAAGMLVSVLWFLGTLASELLRANTALDLEPFGSVTPFGLLSTASSLGWVEVVARAWSVGALVMAARLVRDALSVRRLATRAIRRPSARWQTIFDDVRERIGVRRAVRFAISGLAEVPMVVGWMRPIVLLPASALTGLAPEQIRALLAHELAHVRRLDHWVNAAQAAAETLLFFHPVVWWISREMRIEREYCCDDASVRVVVDAKTFAGALAAMEALRIQTPSESLALAATGGPLMQRITRLVTQRSDRTASTSSRPTLGWQVPLGLVASGFLVFGGSAFATTVSTAIATGDESAVVADDDREDEETRAVKDKLRAAVASGRITEQQAQEHFEGWKAGREKKLRDDDLEATLRRIAEAVEAGDITAEEGKRRVAEVKARADRRAAEHRKLQEVEAHVRALVEAGDITAEDARRKLHDVRMKLEEEHRAAELEWAVERIEDAVAAGEITAEEGKAKLDAVRANAARERSAADHRRLLERVHAHAAEIEAAVAAGKLSPEEAKQKLAEVHRKLAELRTDDLTVRREDAKRKLMAAVEAGHLTKAEAHAKLEELERQYAEGKDATELEHAHRRALEEHAAHAEHMKVEMHAAAAKLDELVASGKLSREEANAKLAAVEKKLAELGDGKAHGESKLEKRKPEKAKAEKAKAEKAKAEKLKSEKELRRKEKPERSPRDEK